MLRQTFSHTTCRNIIELGLTFLKRIKMFTSGFLEDLDRLRKLKKNSLDDSIRFPDACLFIILHFDVFLFQKQ